MIKTKNLTPSIYYNRSRDFQLLGRIYDIVFNYVKLTGELINNAPLSDNFDTNLLDLVATTLGFKEAHDYNVTQLKALCSVFSLALRNKGNIQSINMILKMLANTENINEDCYAEVDAINPYKLNVFLSSGIHDSTLFKDVLNYILPAGMSCDVISQEAVKTINKTIVPFDNTSTRIEKYNGQFKNSFSQVETGTVFEAPIKEQIDEEPLKKLYGNLTNTTVLRVYSGDTGATEIAKLNEKNIIVKDDITNQSGGESNG